MIPDVFTNPSTAFAFGVVWKSSAVLAAAGLAALVSRRRASASTRHALWFSAVAATLAVPFLAATAPAWRLAVLPAAPSVDTVPEVGVGPLPEREASRAEPERVRPTNVPGERAEPADAPGVTATSPAAPVAWWAVAWAAGAAPMSLAMLAGRIGLTRLERKARPVEGGAWDEARREAAGRLRIGRRVRILESPDAPTPMTWGWLRPVVLVPEDSASWSVDRKREVLLHELAHVRRLDGLTQDVARLACVVYWFDPLVWLAARRMRAERERACDDLVLSSGVRPSEYAGHLLEVARGLRTRRARLASLAAVAMARPSQLEGRLLAILDPTVRRGPRRATALTLFTSAFAVSFVLSAVRLQARDSRAEGAERMTVTGRVLGPDGSPMKDAPVEVVARPRVPWVFTEIEPEKILRLGSGSTDADGRFKLDAARTSADSVFEVHAIAKAPGFGLGWVELNPDAAQPAGDVRLEPETTATVRFVDEAGGPAKGVAVRVWSVGRPSRLGTYDGVKGDKTLEVVSKLWPKPLVTDDDGVVNLGGVAAGVTVGLDTDDDRFMKGNVRIKVGNDPAPAEKVTLRTGTRVVGRITAADTGKAVVGTVVQVDGLGKAVDVQTGSGKAKVDAEGRYRVRIGRSEVLMVRAFPPAGSPYFAAEVDTKLNDPNAAEALFDVKLARGVVVRGKVTEGGSGRPLAGASVQFYTRNRRASAVERWQSIVASGPDGSYRITVPPGKGHLFVFGPTSDFVLEEVGALTLAAGKPGGARNYAHRIVPFDVAVETPEVDVPVVLRPGKTVTGRVVGPDGQPVLDPDVRLITTLNVQPFHVKWRGDLALHARDGRFTVRGLDPDGTPGKVDFLAPSKAWGKSVMISAKDSGIDLVVKLEPCGEAKARLVDAEGKPVARTFPEFDILGKPGPPDSRARLKDGQLAADAAYMVNLDRTHYWKAGFSDADGRITFPDLIPGASYRITDNTTRNDDKGPQVRKDFTVKPGETLDLGDVLLEKPRR